MTVFYLLTFVVCGAYFLLMISYLIGWNKTKNYTVKPAISNQQSETKASIIIPARNEEAIIFRCLTSIKKQLHPSSSFEIIVVDDHSTDRTAMVVGNLNIPNLKLIRLSENEYGKKQAITSGIKNASGQLIITTDADCEMGEKWLSTIVCFYEENKSKMIVAPVILKEDNGLLTGIQSQEMIALTASACGSLYYNVPTLCSGANLIYERSAFIAANGFEGVDATSTGDDVFLMLKIQDKFPGSIKYLKSSDAAVFTLPEKKTFSVISQRKRWASKTFLYKHTQVIGVAVLVFFTNFLILLSGLLSAINYKFAYTFLIAFCLKCIIDFMFLFSTSSFFGKHLNPVLFIISSLIYPIYVTAVGLIAPFSSYNWKGRKS